MLRLGSRKPHGPPAWLPEAETVVVDVLEPRALSKAVKGVQAVVHLAAMNENECVNDPRKAVQVNTLGTLGVLRAAIDAGVERFIYISTAHVYGAPLDGHITENTLPRPVHPYAITHHAAEDFVLAAHDHGEIAGIVIRLSNGFGAPTHPDVDRWTLLVNDLCRQAVRDKVLTLRSSGLEQRDFITLHDVGRAVSHFLDMTPTDIADGLFNLGGECPMTVLTMAERIARCCLKTLDYSPEILRPAPGADGKTGHLRYDISKLKRTGFSVNGDIDSEIIQTLEICSGVRQVRAG